MRNGLNISSLSEFVHEIRSTPEEAMLRYHAHASLVHPDLVAIETQTAWAGTIRVARPFTFQAQLPGTLDRRNSITPLEYAQAALLGCVLVTYVYGASSKGIVLSSLSASSEADVCQRGDGQVLSNVRYSLAVDADTDDQTVTGIGRYVSFLSPNHRTWVEKNELLVAVCVKGRGVARAEVVLTPESFEAGAPSLSPAHDSVGCRLAWRYGTQLDGQVVRRLSSALPLPICVDQPKQYMGIDLAANPQELLLAALGSDVLGQLSALARAEQLPLGSARIELGGSLDLRGVMNVERSAPVKLVSPSATLHIESDADANRLQELGLQAFRLSAVCRLLCTPHEVGVAISTRGKEALRFKSNERLLRAQLAAAE